MKLSALLGRGLLLLLVLAHGSPALAGLDDWDAFEVSCGDARAASAVALGPQPHELPGLLLPPHLLQGAPCQPPLWLQAAGRRLLAKHKAAAAAPAAEASVSDCCALLPAGFSSTLPVVVVHLEVSSAAAAAAASAI